MDLETYSEEESQQERKWKRITSAVIWFCSFSVGLAYSFQSPALVELKNKYETTIDEVSVVFTVILVAYLFGALVSGVLFNYLNRQLLMVLYLVTMGAGVLATPYCPTMLTFFVTGGFIGFGFGGVDTSQIVWMLEMWEGEAGPYIQSQYALFALGSCVSPILLKPFLLEEKNATSSPTTPHQLSKIVEEESQLYIPLSIGSGIIFASATCLLSLYFIHKYIPPSPSVEETEPSINPTTTYGTTSADSTEVLVTSTTPRPGGNKWSVILLVVLSAITLGCYQGMEISTVQFIPTFAHYIDLELTEPEGASLLLAFTGAFAFGRFCGIGFVVFNVKPALILMGNAVLTVVGLVLWYFWANSNEAVLWAGSVCLGLGYSTVFAAVYDHIEKNLKITNVKAAIMVISGGLVSALYPLIIGKSVEREPSVLIYTNVFSVVACFVSFGTIWFMTVVKGISEKTIVHQGQIGQIVKKGGGKKETNVLQLGNF